MLVLPMVIDQVDWPTWNSLRREAGEENVTRNLAQQGTDKNAPSALIDILHPEVHKAIRESNIAALGLVSIGFVIVCRDQLALARIQRLTNMSIVTSLGYRDGNIECILKGTLLQIKDLVIAASTELQTKETRELAHEIYKSLSHNSLKDLWMQYKRVKLKDGTYILNHL